MKEKSNISDADMNSELVSVGNEEEKELVHNRSCGNRDAIQTKELMSGDLFSV